MTNSQLTIRVLVEGAQGAVVLVVIAFLLSRFARDICGRSLLVIFLFIAAGAYFGFALLARDILGTAQFRQMGLKLNQLVGFRVEDEESGATPLQIASHCIAKSA